MSHLNYSFVYDSSAFFNILIYHSYNLANDKRMAVAHTSYWAAEGGILNLW